jgi:hypothetical protein
MLTAMGFEVDAAEAALTATGGNVERAGDWLFSHMDDLPAAIASVKGGGAAAGGDAAAAAGNRCGVVGLTVALLTDMTMPLKVHYDGVQHVVL